MKKILILTLIGLINLCRAQSTIDFHISNLEAGPSFGPWMFEMNQNPFVDDGNPLNGEYAYVNLDWNITGDGNPAACTGSGRVSSGTCAAENMACVNGINGITVELLHFRLWQFHHINTVNPNLNWAVLGQAGDERIYGGGTGRVYLNGVLKLTLINCRITMKNFYPAPVGSGDQSQASGWGVIDLNNSDAQWAAELDPQATGQVKFECSSFSPIVQQCYGAYDVDIRVIGGDHVEAMAAANVPNTGSCTVNLTEAKTSFLLSSSANGGAGNDENFISSNLINQKPAGTLPLGITAVGSCYWQLGTTLKTFNTDVVFDISSIPGIQNTGKLRILKRSTAAADWAVWSSISVVDQSHIKALGVSSFSEFGIGTEGENPLPIELMSFTAENSGGAAVLRWVTASELNNNSFSVERSADKADWSCVANIKGAGNSNTRREYSWKDNSISLFGTYYYRLKQTDNDGSFTYSQAVEIKINADGRKSIKTMLPDLGQNYPNPFNPTTTIKITLPEASYTDMLITNSLGQEVMHPVAGYMEAGLYSIPVEAGALPAGIYFYTLRTKNSVHTKKMIVLK